MTLRELALQVRSRAIFTGMLHVRGGSFENNTWFCELEDVGFESSGWSGLLFHAYSGAGKTTAQAWESLAQTLRGKTVRIRKGPKDWSTTFEVPADLIAGDAP